MMQIQHVLPGEIEKESFRIITEELVQIGKTLLPGYEEIIKRVIHTTADFEYADTLCFSPNVKEVIQTAIRQGAYIVTDTNMALAGINKKKLASYGGEALCYMAMEDVALEAKERGCTRAAVSMERAAKLDKPVIFAIGNAPTALISLYELMEKGFQPAAIIGVPVGFVNVVASKELIMESEVPYIINKGRKGGSTVAAAICNAILYGMEA